ncbi:Stk1 family PASTA domain-containing Ser/Thr kinase [Leuconostoc gelidum subsp. gasicomitatum]|uniref:Stk1 family PASTA domain-containing Ser/Thr kinase n=1 Tax=Leuconostoc gasicomitatum TaxID=115778 RepID=UPI0007E02BCB|nr:Stk1 family PASTA domain-containing Ser/Thr kinase [Leuconostoc gasicomitatum]MBZ5947904.1 Stk1 family PASTA domain-containing Ser/Thr kinase [Leuconostoc gasicomitatum]CUW12331.1 Serine/threonine protein kinase PrkC, regulator of stationary phase [Leuconostoc gasicomitatum]
MLPDTVIDNRYKIIKSLGGGGMANVYLAHDEFLDRDVTFKMMRLDMKNDVELAKRFQREAISATELVHDNIVQVYDTGEYEGTQYLVMEYVEGNDLKSFIAEHFPIPYQQVVDIMTQVLSAVQAAHDADIIHRDLKPQNILIDKHCQVKITDFGIAIAKSVQDMTQTNTVIGSVHYLSPEQTRGGLASAKSDIYALGVMLYEMLTKQVPYEGDTPVAVAMKHTTEEMPSVRDFDPRIPQALENVILKATAKRPQDRYLSAAAMSEDLNTTLSPRRSDEIRFAPMSDTIDETRIIPMAQIQDQLKTGVSSDKIFPDEVPEEPSIKDVIISHGKKGYSVKDIAHIVDRTPNYVRSVLRGNGIKFRKLRKWPWVLLGLFLTALVAIVFLNYQSNKTTVPNVINLTQDQATMKIKKAGLVVGTVSSTPSKTITNGHVVRTTRSSGAEAKKGDTINLIISSGRAKVRFGDYVGSDYDVTATQLRAQGYSVTRKDSPSDSVSEGRIILQSVDANGKVDPTATNVEFTVSTGAQRINVPDFTGKSTQEQVQSWASEHDIVVNFNTQYDGNTKKDHVISQSIRGGSSITKDMVLLVTISQGPQVSSSDSSDDSSSSNESSSSSSSNASSSSSSSSSASSSKNKN